MKELAQNRNDVVGSLLRPAKLKQAWSRFDGGAVAKRAETRPLSVRI